ncbi:hypothetical protein E0W72_12880 [Flavobacterium arcticum]|nr:hypothetical protein [Flavobacterium arcticum]KAF2506521.1 hypothetical protein E0W72_12880 [Flavobacterium arcticum]
MAQGSLEDRFAVPQPVNNENKTNINTVYPYKDVDIYPYYNDGIEEFYTIFNKKLWVPSGVRKKANLISIYIHFIVEKDGRLSNIDSNVSGINARVSEGLKEEIIKAMKKMPNWVPGKVNGDLVRVKVVIPYYLTIRKRD